MAGEKALKKLRVEPLPMLASPGVFESFYNGLPRTEPLERRALASASSNMPRVGDGVPMYTCEWPIIASSLSHTPVLACAVPMQ